MVVGLLVAVAGLALLAWPSSFVAWVRLYRSGSVLSINAPVKNELSVQRTQAIGRIVGLALLICGVVIAVAL